MSPLRGFGSVGIMAHRYLVPSGTRRKRYFQLKTLKKLNFGACVLFRC